jgi:hypothetical protein
MAGFMQGSAKSLILSLTLIVKEDISCIMSMTEEDLKKINGLLITILVSPSNWPIWRKRRILNISSVDQNCYRLRTSYQLQIPKDMLSNVCSLLDIPFDDKRFSGSWPLFIPLDWLPKHVLIDFSVFNPKGHRIPVLLRRETTDLTYEHILRPQLHLALYRFKFTSNSHHLKTFESLLKSLINQSPNRKEVKVIDTGGSPEQIFKCFKSFWLKSLSAFPEHYKILVNKKDKVTQLLELVEHLLETCSSEDGFKDYALNPLLLAVDYFKIQKREAPSLSPYQVVDGYLTECDRYLGFLKTISTSTGSCIKEIYEILTGHSQFYYLFFKVEEKPDEDFILKTEQIIPIEAHLFTEASKFKAFANWRANLLPIIWYGYRKFLSSQQYPISLGKESSLHIEVECPAPAELRILPKRCFIEAGNKRLHIDELFRYSPGSSQGVQHYYTSKSRDELIAAIKSEKLQISLWMRYSLDWMTKFVYGFGIVFLLLVMFHYKSDSSNTTSAPYPLFFSIIVALLLTIRSKEPIVEAYLRWWKTSVLVLLFVVIDAMHTHYLYDAYIFWAKYLTKYLTT